MDIRRVSVPEQGVRGSAAGNGAMNIGVMSNQARRAQPVAPERQSAADSEAQFERVFLEQYTRVYSLLTRLLDDRDEAEDLALETFWRLHRHPATLGESLNLGGWLYRVATNLGLNALRARKRRVQHELDAGKLLLERSGPADPLDSYLEREEQDRVRAVLAGMDSRQAELLILRHSGMSYQETAAALGLSPNSIGTLLLRAEREFEKRYREAESKRQ